MKSFSLQSSAITLALSEPPVSGFRPAGNGVPCCDGREVSYELVLEGTPAQVSLFISQLERLLEQARRGEAARLVMTDSQLEGPREVKIFGGGLQRRNEKEWRGGLVLEMKLLRSDHWQGEESELPLHCGGSAVTGGQVISNHHDLEHSNDVTILAEDVPGDLPGLARLELAPENPLDGLGEVFVCLDAAENAPGRWLALEAEAAAGGSPVNSGECSGGAYRVCDVLAYATPLLTWTLTGQLLSSLNGGVYRPLLRFASAPAGENTWCWWRLSLGEAVLWESGHERLLPGRRLQELGALALPGLPGEGAPAALTLALMGLNDGGSTEIALDFAQLCPLSGWRRYVPVQNLPGGETLVDDGDAGQVYARSQSGAHLSHAGMGAPLALLPGRTQRLYVLHDGAAGAVTRVRVWYRAAWI